MRRCIGLILFLLLVESAKAQTAGIEFFEKKIRPVLVEHCYECHAVNSKKVRGGLLLDSRDGLRRGGFNGPAIVPGNPDQSLLIKAVRYTDPETKMPKKGKLPANMIADLETWVKMGAPDPRDKVTTAKSAKTWDEIVAERRKWWSLQPVKKPATPMPKNVKWSDDAIDRFLLSAMEAKGLAPAPDADPRTLIRRLSLVLTGLPPTANEINEFVKAWDAASAKRQAALENLVDRLLDSPHFGERWARHWLDIVRFTETHGNEWNYDVHHAWRYRDYLIRAFNQDVPYDQLVREHIAGDLLRNPRWSINRPLTGLGSPQPRFNESIIGTAFYRFGEVNHDDCIDLRSIGYDLADNQIDTLTKAFQAMTVACARCHDHKLDAISVKDYHGMLGILRSSRQVAHTIDGPDVNVEIQKKMHMKKAEIRAELAQVWMKSLAAANPDKVKAFFKDEKVPLEHALAPARMLQQLREKDKLSLADAVKKVADFYVREDAERTKFNKENFTLLADFRNGEWPDWQIGGQALRGKPSKAGDFAITIQDGKPVATVLPAGAFTHVVSEKLNGTLRSPVLNTKKKYISFQVLGGSASAVRLVSNNCQLNYRNFKYLTKNELHWITFPIPSEADGLRVYAEIMTKFDNPKFPDQLGALGSGKDYRMPWDKAAADPRSHFGVTHVVLHDQPAPPKASLTHLRTWFTSPPTTEAGQAMREGLDALEAMLGWRNNDLTDETIKHLEALLKVGHLSNRLDQTPKLKQLADEYAKLDAELSLPQVAPGVADFGAGFDQAIFTRGDCMKPGEKTPRRYVEVLAREPIKPEGSGRLELANAIASKENPLTSRVMVNRVWHHLFGAGLVRTVDDFGHVGELPSHPELLDYLADRFARSPGMSAAIIGDQGMAWSVKKLIRVIVLTRAFRLSHTPSVAMIEADPENRLLARYPARRMEAEAIRDSLLATSGRLDRTLYGPSISAYREKEYADRRLFKGPLDGDGRRSIYIRVTLMEPPKFLEIFNFPGGKVCQGRRDVTNTPAQALAMLNDPFVHQQAEVWAKRLLSPLPSGKGPAPAPPLPPGDLPGVRGKTVDKRIELMFRTALGREPRKEERERFGRFVSQLATLHSVPADDVLSNEAVWRDAAHAMFNLQEFITIP